MKRNTHVYVEAGFRFVVAAVVLGCAALMVVMLVGCDPLKRAAKVGAGIVIDCTKTEVVKVTNEMAPMVDSLLIESVDGDGAINWDPVKDAAKRWTAEVGGCILADAVQRALRPQPVDPKAPQSSPLDIDKAALMQGFAAFKAEQFGAVTFTTAAGSI